MWHLILQLGRLSVSAAGIPANQCVFISLTPSPFAHVIVITQMTAEPQEPQPNAELMNRARPLSLVHRSWPQAAKDVKELNEIFGMTNIKPNNNRNQ